MGGNPLLFIGGIGGLEILLLLVVLFPIALWFWALIDLLKSNFRSGIDKLIWAVVLIFIPVVGVLLYLLIGRNQKVNHLP